MGLRYFRQPKRWEGSKRKIRETEGWLCQKGSAKQISTPRSVVWRQNQKTPSILNTPAETYESLTCRINDSLNPTADTRALSPYFKLCIPYYRLRYVEPSILDVVRDFYTYNNYTSHSKLWLIVRDKHSLELPRQIHKSSFQDFIPNNQRVSLLATTW